MGFKPLSSCKFLKHSPSSFFEPIFASARNDLKSSSNLADGKVDLFGMITIERME